jgi:MYXO-CTERM domain-containing protein
MRFTTALIGVAALAVGALSVDTQAGFLLDYGSDGASDGWAVSGANQAFGGFSQFQSFTVTDPEGWIIDFVGIDGYVTFDPNNMGLEGTLLPDDGGSPDEGNPIASATYFLSDDAFGGEAWVDEAFDVVLAPGTYWFRAEARDADYSGTWRSATMGAGNAFSRRNSDGAEFPHETLALRIQGQVAPAPGALAMLLLGAGFARRRRR